MGSVLPANSEDDGWRSPTLRGVKGNASMSWLANKRIKELEESLRAERAVNTSLNLCLDEALEVIANSRPTIDTQRAMIDSLKATLGEYQHILDSQVAPLCKEVIALCGGRAAQRAFVLDDQ